jgi:hypothetical protein
MTIEGGESISEPHKDGYLSWFPPYENRVGWGTLVVVVQTKMVKYRSS